MGARRKKKEEAEETSGVTIFGEEEEVESSDFQERIIDLASTIDSMISTAKVSNSVAVNSLKILLCHASAQMYSAAFGRPDLHEAIAADIEEDFLMLMDVISGKASMLVKIAELKDMPKIALPN